MKRKLLLAANIVFSTISSIASSGIIADAVRAPHAPLKVTRAAGPILR
jgi:hypothetical protein